MLYYNTGMPDLVMPEYGRNIQQMVDYCLQIPDRNERTHCACTIVSVMANMFPENRDMQKFWDHLNMMSGFRLDVDFPVDVVGEENAHPKASKIPYKLSHFRYRHYGKIIEEMIDKVADMDEGEDKDDLISMIAHHMKKLMLMHNKECMTDAKVLRDLYVYSGGRIDLKPEIYILRDFKDIKEPVQTKKKKKK